MTKPKCAKCEDTGIWETGNNDLPCPDCPAGDTALFNCAGVDGLITGAEMRRHFLNSSPEPIKLGKERFLASELPGRPVEWMGAMHADPPGSVQARVWRVTSCDAMYVMQLTFAPWCLDPEDRLCGFKRSHLSVVNAIDGRGESHVFYVHEHACQVQHVYTFTPGKMQLWMKQNSEAPIGYEATVVP